MSAIDPASAPGFEAVFGAAPDVLAAAPGRVNLLGEHTDYNDGHVLPIAIPQQTTVGMRASAGPGITLHAQNFGQTVEFTLDDAPPDQFARYVFGCLREAARAGVNVPPLQIHVASPVPMGVGLSSSAALEVATLRALRELTAAPWDDVRIAQLAQRAEVEHAGVRCGIMDQMAASLAGSTHALWLDTRTLERRLVPLPGGSEILVLHSGIERTLAASGYNTRRAECERAAELLGLASLRDISDPAVARQLPEPLRRRVRHVLTENARVLQAVEADAERFGELMNASHTSMRDDYEVSHPQLDRLVALLQGQPDVYGARLTGGGFGGACVALCKAGTPRALADLVLAVYQRDNPRGRLLVPWQAGARSPRKETTAMPANWTCSLARTVPSSVMTRHHSVRLDTLMAWPGAQTRRTSALDRIAAPSLILKCPPGVAQCPTRPIPSCVKSVPIQNKAPRARRPWCVPSMSVSVSSN
ncbi:MAG: galactokinase [Chitinophagaceae bacterium]|nr:galactokinase [Rubrivivax sp.]